ncbi:MAG: Lipid A export ATP-binding/permease protein MsbA [Chlamydiae bacterium]|nr:Lipid A export ATP-binding/permease protein MsbA [Chlamydiota bacterium]
MKKLFLAAFKNPKQRLLITFSILAMCFLTLASQLEILALGVITKKGPDFFELFAPEKDGVLQRTEEISRGEVKKRWDEVATTDKDIITKNDTKKFFKRVKSPDRIQQVINFLDGYFPVSGNLKNLAIALVFVALLKAVTLFSHRFSTRILAIRVSRDLRQEYFEHIQSLPMEFYQKYNIGTLSSRVVGDAALIGDAVTSVLVNYLQTPFTVITTLTLCFLTSWQLSLIVFLGLPAIIIPIVYISRKVRKISKQIQQNQEKFASVLIDFLAGIQTVKMFAMEDFSLKKYKEQNQRMADLEKKSARYDLSSRPIVHTIGMSFLSIALMWGLYVLKMSVAEVFFFCGLLYVFYEPVKKFAEENSHIQRGISAADRLFEVMSIQPQIVDHDGAETLTDFQKEIEFDKVSFRYNEQWVIKNLSFRINKGQTVAIVGPTGAGKSTVVQLLPRLYEVQEGEIRIDGKPINTYTQKSLREKIAFVPQKPFLFLDTVSENISFGRPFSQSQIVDAAKRAHADEFIRKLPEGYHTELSEYGKNLSGGQQQRLAIARALVKDAPILIMDEATSSLDNVSENSIKTAIKELRGQMTQIIIAHRLTTIEDADKIIYLEDGEKIAEGTKDQLLKTCHGFKQMWDVMHKHSIAE